jgi:hypothetical protein
MHPYEEQIITRQDALELAAALGRALVDVPNVPKANELIEKQTTHVREMITPSSSLFVQYGRGVGLPVLCDARISRNANRD